MIKATRYSLAFIAAISLMTILRAQELSEDATNNELSDYLIDKFTDRQTNRFYSIESALKFADEALSLDLSNSELEAVPSEIGQLINLEELDLSGNSIKTIPADIAKLSKLEIIDLSNNELEKIPSDLCKLTMLSELKLNGNKITSISGASCLKSVKKLLLQNNEIKEVPGSDLNALSGLEQLMLHGNEFTFLPDEICQFDNLNVLTLPNDIMFRSPTCLKHFQYINPKLLLWTRADQMSYIYNRLEEDERIHQANSRRKKQQKEYAQMQLQQQLSVSNMRIAGHNYVTKDVQYPSNFKPITIGNRISFIVLLPISIPRLIISKRYYNRFHFTKLMRIDQKIDAAASSSPPRDTRLNFLEKRKNFRLKLIR